MKSILESLIDCKNRPKNKVAVKIKKNKKWIDIHWQEYYDSVMQVASSLIEAGVSPGDSVAIMSDTRHEWLFTDLAIQAVGAITIPIYKNSHPDEMEHIINDSNAKFVFLEDEGLVTIWDEAKSKCPNIKEVFIFDESNNFKHWQALCDNGKNLIDTHQTTILDRISNVSLDDLFTIIYTSGTTGTPKGVRLTHRQIASELTETFDFINITDQDTFLSFLPTAHVFGRVELLGGLHTGCTIAFCESVDAIRKNLNEISPTIMIAVPRVYEKIYNGVLSQAETSKIKNKIFKWALNVGSQVSKYKRNKKNVPIALLAQYKVAYKLIFGKLHEKLGGKLRFLVSGGAPLERKVAEFFHAAGILIIEGYGLTETTAAVCANNLLDYEFGTVGKPFGDVDIKIADDGEILVKSDKVMAGYHNNEQATQEVFENGYFKTGDIGEWTPKGNLKITDRKKDLIKTSGGKYVAPQKLEKLVKINPYISNVLIYGDKRKYIVALITLDPESITAYAQTNNISYSSVEALAKNEDIFQIVKDAVAQANSELMSYESIKKFSILPRDFTIEDGEMTPSLKLKRKVCTAKHQDLLDSLYGIDKGSL